MGDPITEHMDIWTSAQVPKTNGGRGRSSNGNGQGIYGIKKLRELILELAVRGKLVPQDPSDEPASVLLERIAEEKKRLVKDGKIKKQKALPEISNEKKPFRLPNGWSWARFPEIGEFGRGKSKHRPRNDPALYLGGEYPMVQTGDVARSNGIIETYTALYNETGLLQSRIWPQGTLCITIAANIADTGILGFDACFPDSVVGLVPSGEFENSKYFEYFMRTAKDRLTDFAPSTAQKNINLGILEKVNIPLPPLEEIKRIAAKVDELMTLCDQLEQQQIASNDTHQTLVETLLTTLTNATDPKEFADTWQRIADHFDILFATEQSIDQLKQTILQLAVMGKLVPQDPNDEPASVSLEKIAEEKKRLHKEGKIKNQKALPEISKEEIPFEIAKGWVWTRLGLITQINPRNEADDQLSVSFVPMPLISTSYTGEHSQETKIWGEVKKGYTHFTDGDIGIAKITPCFENSKAVIFSNLRNGIGAGTTELHIARPFGLTLDPRYLLLHLKTPRFLNTGETKMTGTAGQKRLPKDFFSEFPLPFPPLAEQHRIVAKVYELMTICEDIKEHLKANQTTQIQLADAIVEKAVAVQ